jgi:hypothetical protein
MWVSIFILKSGCRADFSGPFFPTAKGPEACATRREQATLVNGACLIVTSKLNQCLQNHIMIALYITEPNIIAKYNVTVRQRNTSFLMRF